MRCLLLEKDISEYKKGLFLGIYIYERVVYFDVSFTISTRSVLGVTLYASLMRRPEKPVRVRRARAIGQGILIFYLSDVSFTISTRSVLGVTLYVSLMRRPEKPV